MSFLSTIWDAIWLFLSIFVMVVYLIALFSIITDLFRDRKMKGIWKAVWLLFLMFLPFLTALVYLVTRGSGMADRAAIQSVAAREATEDYIRGVAGGATGEISHAKQLLDSGAITAAEFDQLKKAALAKAT